MLSQFKSRLSKLEKRLKPGVVNIDIPEWQKKRLRIFLIVDKKHREEELTREEQESLDWAHAYTFEVLKILFNMGITEILTEEGITSIEHLKGIERKEDLPYVLL